MNRRQPFRRLIPEVVQTSAMDCGPAALAAVLQGCGRQVSYPRLRELCQTDVDGTSVDTLEELAGELGVEAEQVMLPRDCIAHGKANSALPCIAVVRLPSGLTHFVVAWREDYGLIQVMDPATGRRWMPRQAFLDSLYQHSMAVPAADWLAYARSAEFTTALLARLRRHLDRARAQQLLDQACAAGSWQALADLDALVRMAGAARDRGQPRRTIAELFADFERDTQSFRELIPEHHYQVTAADTAGQLWLRGAVLVRVTGELGARNAADDDGQLAAGPALGHVQGSRPVNVFAELRAILRNAGMRHALPVLVLAGGLVGLLTLIEGLLFRVLLDFDMARDPLLLALLATVLLVPLGVGVLLDRGAFGIAHSIGRRLDALLRIRLLRRLPRLRESYFESRLISDLAERGHAITELKALPELLLNAASTLARIFWIGLGLIVLAPDAAALVLAMMAVAVLMPALLYHTVAEADLRARAHLAALGRVHLDTLRGAEPIWSHGAGAAMAVAHESLLRDWRRNGTAMLKTITLGEALTTGTLMALAAWLVLSHLTGTGLSVGSVLLLAYWSLILPPLASQVFDILRLAPQKRNIIGRVLELFAPDELEHIEDEERFRGPVELRFAGVTIQRARNAVLSNVDLHIPRGQRVAIVGVSGSGKSTLLDAILGFQPIAHGTLDVDGRAGTPSVLTRLREQTVWIDAELYLWNRSIVENLLYGTPPSASGIDHAITTADLRSDLSRMRDGMATRVGENGARLSGGEGQRVRIARGLLREDPSLVLLDEPFRGMDRRQRRQLLSALLRRWPGVTMLCVSHDVSETLEFDRVLVIADGAVVEDGAPAALRADTQSHYSRLLRLETLTEVRLSAPWHHLWLGDGSVEARRDRRSAQ